MHPALRPNTVMLIWQCVQFAVFWVPLVAAVGWAFDGELRTLLIGLAFAAVPISGFIVLARFVTEYGFRDDEPTASESADGTRLRTMLKSLRLPDEYRNFTLRSHQCGMFGYFAAYNLTDDIGIPLAISVMTVVWLVGIGVCWWLWSRGGLRGEPETGDRPEKTPEGAVAIMLVRDMGDGGDAVRMRWRAVEGCTLARLVRDIPGTGILSSISGGERQWEVAADGEPVAVLTQSWTGSKWWPEPEWLVDPETPFTGERVALTLREFQTR